MNKLKNNDYKKILRANWILIGTSTINAILMLIARVNIYELKNWIGYSSWAIFIFCVFVPLYVGSLMIPFVTKAEKQLKQKNPQNKDISVKYINVNIILINIIYMLLSLFWLFLASWYLININILQAIFVIFISIFSVIYISYCFFYQTKIKINKIKLSSFLEIKKQKCHCLCNLNLENNENL